MVSCLKRLKVLKSYGPDISSFICKLSASNSELDCSYVFFLDQRGRYLADCFFIRSLQCFIATSSVLQNLRSYLETMDIRGRFSFDVSVEDMVFYSDCVLVGRRVFEDPRMPGYYLCFNVDAHLDDISTDFYNCLRMRFKIAEFEDFVIHKSIILNYGAVNKFISRNKGCYPGQELIARFNQSVIKKTVDVVDELDESVLQVLLELDKKFLVYKIK